MMVMNESQPPSAPLDVVEEDARAAAVARLHDLFTKEGLSFTCFCEVLGQILTSPTHAALERTMSALPSLVRLTPVSRRLAGPLVLRVPDGKLALGSGWQLAADTTIGSGFGSARVDLTIASWDAREINLRLETWGSIELLVPEGVAVQITRGSGASVELEALSPAVPGGPVLRISTSGPTGVIRIRHPKQRDGKPFARWRRRRIAGEHGSARFLSGQGIVWTRAQR